MVNQSGRLLGTKIQLPDPASHAISFLGTLANAGGAREPAIIRIEKTALHESSAEEFAQIVHDVEQIGDNDIVRLLLEI